MAEERRCAANCCRKAATTMVSNGDTRLALCDRHGRVYSHLGYKPEPSAPSPQSRTGGDG